MPPQFIISVDGEPLKQGTDAWRKKRMGKATASNFGRVVTEVKGEYAAGADKYAREIAIQRMLDEDTEKPIDGLYWPERGKLLEGDAVKLYESLPGHRTTDAIGLIISEDNTRACSPDRISADRLWGAEIKCPSGDEHLLYMRLGGPEKKYRWQVLGSILVAEFDGWDFVSYHPRLREVVKPYARKDYKAEIATLDEHLKTFEGQVQAYCALIEKHGYVEMENNTGDPRSDDEWRKLLDADPNLWAIA